MTNHCQSWHGGGRLYHRIVTHRMSTSWFCLWFWRNRRNAVAMFLASALMKSIHPLEIFKMVDIQGANASHKRTGQPGYRSMASAFRWRIITSHGVAAVMVFFNIESTYCVSLFCVCMISILWRCLTSINEHQPKVNHAATDGAVVLFLETTFLKSRTWLSFLLSSPNCWRHNLWLNYVCVTPCCLKGLYLCTFWLTLWKYNTSMAWAYNPRPSNPGQSANLVDFPLKQSSGSEKAND